MDHSSRRRSVIAGIAGNVMEWYDFAVYGYFAKEIGDQFFPSSEPSSSLIASFGAFAAGYVMRPLGGLVFGHIGDRVGRKSALTLSVLAMAIPTFLIGILPDHSQIGGLAAVLLVAMRMVQGLSVGGEYTTSVVFLVEGAPADGRGLAGSWSPFGAGAGILLGSATGAVINTVLPAEAVAAWGWRLPFLLGLVVGLAGLYIRRHIPEPPNVDKKETASAPIVEAFRTELPAILKIVGFNLALAVSFYMIFVYAVTYFNEVDHLAPAEALDINTINMVVMLLLVPIMGWLSDHIGRKPLLVASTAGLVILAYPLFLMMHNTEFVVILFGQMGFAVLVAMFSGAGPTTMVEALPTRVRCTALSVGYNLSVGVIGGLTPLIATYLMHRSADDFAPAYYLITTGVISLGVISTMPETYRQPLR